MPRLLGSRLYDRELPIVRAEERTEPSQIQHEQHPDNVRTVTAPCRGQVSGSSVMVYDLVLAKIENARLRFADVERTRRMCGQ